VQLITNTTCPCISHSSQSCYSILCYTIDRGMLSIKLMMRANDEGYNWKLYPFMWNTFTRIFQVLNDHFQKAWQFFPMLVSSNWQKSIYRHALMIVVWICPKFIASSSHVYVYVSNSKNKMKSNMCPLMFMLYDKNWHK
jgi:hypothetical protein